MRHHNSVRKFSRETGQRRALLRSLAEAIATHGKIMTTVAKAKELRPFIEKMITIGKKNTLTSKRFLVKNLGTVQRASTVSKCAEKYADRAGGYTRIVKLQDRMEDGSPMAVIEFV
ncbi:MAG: 50S ribosomal protein L17 [Candidatus Vogelbacteria bacterium]|nr:50S ribosomal protein L17 [Candidatus Vogelbacteria bacterium]